MRKAGVVMTDEQGYPTKEQVNKIIEAAKSHRNKLLIILLSHTGRRVSELIQLKPNDINYENKTIKWHILKKKDKDLTVNIPADDYVLGVLKKYISYYNVKDDERIININRHRVYQIIRMLGYRAGVETIGSKPIHPHHFRHYYAMTLAESSKTPVDVSIIKDLLQHSDVNVTLQYFKMSGKRKRELIESAFQ